MGNQGGRWDMGSQYGWVMSNQQTYQRPPSNGLGTAGFVVSLVGIFTAGLLCPIGLLLSFFGLFKRPRGLAIAGFIIGLVGTAIVAVVLLLLWTVGLAAFHLVQPIVKTEQVIREAQTEIDAVAITHGRIVPNDQQGQELIRLKRDGWGRPLQYRRLSAQGYELRSAGKDGVFGTEDDDANIHTLAVP